MRIHRLQIKNFLGIESLDTSVPPSGAVIAGSNGRGKTSCLKAVAAALANQGVDEHAIRLGAERAELTVDLDNLSVRRVIARGKSSTLTVTNADGFKAPKPATMLSELLGTGATIDPLALFLAAPKDRRKQILAALPVSVTIEQLREWVPTIPDGFDCTGHGLEVIERVRKIAYDKRTVANAAAKKARDDADRARADADRAAEAAPIEAGTVADARAAQDRAKAHLSDLQAQQAAAGRSAERTAKARERVIDLRRQADAVRLPEVDATAIDRLRRTIEGHDAQIAEVEAQLADLRRAREAASAEHHALVRAVADHRASLDRARDLEAQAAELESTIAEASTPAPTVEAIGAASAAIDRADQALANAEAAERAAIVAQRAKELADAADAAEKDAGRLDAIVRTLANDAPAKLLANANAIPGLSLNGDEILLDGKSLDALCGAEQLRFAVQIAKRAAAKVKLLLCDGVERLDPEQFETFVREATEGDWQLLCTKVTAGEVHIEAISADLAEAAE